MKYVIAILASLVAPVAAQACDPLGVCSQAVVVQGAAVQQHAVAVQAAQVQAFAVQAYAAPVVVQSFAVVPQAVVVQQTHFVQAQGVVVQSQGRHCGGKQGGPIVNALGALRPNKGNVTKIKIRQK